MSAHKDELFDSVVFFEENCQGQGYESGFNEGRMKGWQEGYKTGMTQGKLIGDEIGFYKGFIQTWQALAKNDSKLQLKLASLAKLLDQDWIDTTQDIMAKLKNIRAKYKQICSMLNISIEHSDTNSTNKLSF